MSEYFFDMLDDDKAVYNFFWPLCHTKKDLMQQK